MREALIWVVPESDFGAVVCTNTDQPQAFPACDEMIVHLMMAHAAAKKTKPDEAQAADPGNVTPERLVGRYQLNPKFIFDVRNDNGRLLLPSRTSQQMKYSQTHQQNGRTAVSMPSWSFIFEPKAPPTR